MKLSPWARSLLLSMLSGLVGLSVGRMSLGFSQVVDIDESIKEAGQSWEGEFLDWPRTNGKLLVNKVSVGSRNILAPLVPPEDDLVVFDKRYKNCVQIDNTHVGAWFNLQSEKRNSIMVYDKDGKGLFKNISYDMLDSEGKPTGLAMDADRDGQPELRSYIDGMNGKDEPKIRLTERYVENSWYTSEKKDGKYFVLVNGQPREIVRNGAKYQFR